MQKWSEFIPGIGINSDDRKNHWTLRLFWWFLNYWNLINRPSNILVWPARYHMGVKGLFYKVHAQQPGKQTARGNMLNVQFWKFEDTVSRTVLNLFIS